MEKQNLNLTVGDVEFFEEATGMSFSQFDPETQPMGKSLVALAAIGLYQKGDVEDRAAGMAAARELPFTVAVELMEELTSTLGE